VTPAKQQVPRFARNDKLNCLSTEFLKDREGDASQLNRLGVTYFLLGLFLISVTDYIG
jgi:hypothetical protein